MARTFALNLGGIENINGSAVSKDSGEVAIVSGNEMQMLQGPQPDIAPTPEENTPTSTLGGFTFS
tara:strand:- start:555 stop:749 length:195 start_codon:yes stop_codon:yes gene_type:complete